MTSSDVTWQAAANQPRCRGRGCRWGKIAIVVVAASFTLYTIFWFVLAHIVQNHVLLELEKAQEGRGVFHCDDVHKTGYPLRVGVVCSNLNWQSDGQDIVASLTSLVADAPIYAPSRRSIHLQAPAHFELAPNMMQDGVFVDANWNSLDIQANFVKDTLANLRLSAENLRLKQTSDTSLDFGTRLDLPFSGAEFIRLDMGSEGRHFFIKLLFDAVTPDLKLEEEGEPLPNLSGDIHIMIDAGHDLPVASAFKREDEFDVEEHGRFAGLLGQSGQVQRAILRFASGGGLEGQGTFSVSQTGLLSADLSVAIDDMLGLQRTLRPLLPSQAGNLETIFFALNTMPKNADGAPVLPVKIDEGNIRIGFLPVGKIPPILPIDETENE